MAGKQTLTQRIALDGGKEIQAELEALGKSGQQVWKELQASAQQFKGPDSSAVAGFKALGAQLDAFGQSFRAAGNQSGLDKATQSTKNLKDGLDSTGKSARSLGQTLASAFSTFARDLGAAISGVTNLAISLGAVALKATTAIAGIALAAQAAAAKLAGLGSDAAVQIKDAADALGLTTDAYQKFIARSEAAGVAQSDVEDALKRIDKAATEAARSYGGFTKSVQTIDGATVTVTGFSKGLGTATAEGKKAEEAFKALGLRMSEIAKASPEERINLITAALAKLPESAKRDALALELLGNSWRKTLAFFTLGKGEIKDATDEFAASTRKLSEAQIEAGVAYKNAKADLIDAVQATLKQIGLLFTPGATKRAEWLTKLVDDMRPATLGFAELVKQKAALFNQEVGGARGLLANTLIVLGQASQKLADIWTTNLAPAARVLHGLIGLVADEINKLLGTKFTAKQLEILTIIGYLVGGFGLLKAVIAPVIALVGAFATLLVGLAPILVPIAAVFIAFWDEIKAGAKTAFDFILSKADEVKLGFKKLFAGDYKGAWAVFAKLGTEAFDAIKGAAGDAYDNIKGIFVALRTAILFVRAALGVVANVLNALFGTKLTGATLGIYLAFFKLAGVLGTLAQLVPVVTGLVNLLGSKFFILTAAIVVLYRLLPDLQKLFTSLGDAFNKFINGDTAGAIDSLSAGFSRFWATLKEQSASTWLILGAGAALALGRIGVSLTALLGPLGAVAAAALLIYYNWAAIKKGFDEAFSPQQAGKARSFWEYVGRGAAVLTKTVREIFENLNKGFNSTDPSKIDGFWQRLGRGAAVLIRTIREIFDNISKGFQSTDSSKVDGFWQRVGRGAANVVRAVKEVNDIFGSLQKGFEANDGSKLDGFWEHLGHGAADVVAAVKTVIGVFESLNKGFNTADSKGVDGFWERLGRGAAKFLELLKAVNEELKSLGTIDIKSPVSTLFDDLFKDFKDVPERLERVKNNLANAINALIGIGSAKAADGPAAAGGPFASLEAQATAVFERIKTAATETVAAVGSIFAGATIAAPDAPGAASDAGNGLAAPTTAFAAITTSATEAFDKLKTLATDTVQAITEAFAGLTVDWSKLAGDADAIWQGLKDKATETADFIVAAFEGITIDWTALTDGIKQIGSETQAAGSIVDSVSASMVTAFNNVRDAALEAARAAASIDGGSGMSGDVSDPSSGFASGGHVRGPGTGTSDSIRAWLSNGEYVVRAAAVRRYGKDFLAALNAGRLKLPGFARGGAVGQPTVKKGLPAFAGGGLVSAMSSSLGTLGNPMIKMPPPRVGSGMGDMVPANIHIGGHTMPVMAQPNVLRELHRAAGHKKLTTAGQKPSWYK